MREPLKFTAAVLTNWGSIVTSGVLIGVISIWQATGHYVPHWIYWFVASLGLLRAFYRTWLAEHQGILTLTTQLTDEKTKVTAEREHTAGLRTEISRLTDRYEEDDKKELIKAITLLHSMQSDVTYWREIVKDKWGMPPSTVKLLPDDWSTVLYASEKISHELREKADVLESELVKANSLIAQFLNMQPNFRDQRLMPPAFNLLDQAVSRLSNITTEFEAFEKSSRLKTASR